MIISDESKREILRAAEIRVKHYYGIDVAFNSHQFYDPGSDAGAGKLKDKVLCIYNVLGANSKAVVIDPHWNSFHDLSAYSNIPATAEFVRLLRIIIE